MAKEGSPRANPSFRKPLFGTFEALYIYIYIWRTPHFMGRYSAYWAFLPSFIVINAHNLQPLKGGCKFVFLFSSFSLLLPFSALFFLFPLILQISKPQNCPPIEVCGVEGHKGWPSERVAPPGYLAPVRMP